jgi:nucleoside-diphosphate-sugar epimerase
MILVTGANGFVGHALCAHLAQQGLSVRRAVRGPPNAQAHDVAAVGDIGPDTDWRAALQDVDAIVHLAARVHVMRDTAVDPQAEFRRVNVGGTRHLARMAAKAGVRRFVFLSSVKVNGESSQCPFRETDQPHPEDAYGVSKWEAEQALMTLAREAGMQWVVLRPPLIYGPGVGANFLKLMRALDRGLPLPLGALENRRSLLYLGNLVDAIRVCLSHSAAVDQVFLLSDGEDVSTPELVHRLAAALRVRPPLVSVPLRLLRLAGRVTGRMGAVERLTGSLQVDSSKIRAALGWAPPFSLDQGLAHTADWYRKVVADRR